LIASNKKKFFVATGFLNIWQAAPPGCPRVGCPGWCRASGHAGRVCPLGERGQDHQRGDLLRRDPLGRRDPVQDGHLDVQDHQIRLQRRGGRAKRVCPTLELARSGTLTSGGPPEWSALGPGSPIGSQAMASNAIQCGFESHPGHKKVHQNVSGS
jgi:hypothetical protein